MILISACLIGQNVRYDGGNKLNHVLKNLVETGIAKPICPEILGGLNTPREPAEIVGGDGYDVLNGKARVVDKKGNNVTKEYIAGANKALKICKKLECTKLILKADSPTCGSNNIYSGNFDGTKKKGVGVFVALLKQNNIKVCDETNFAI
ncbi:DUF523 domain-containing protein [Staphylococcus lugdunensis]|uniref:DUF523 domain-containing protein n=1 Tax=Staphylococcus lugdunensis TaxID=28035 RepID=UPI000763D828|nr:DUF523 domain-containing protein [Staphylococcus lugdunensis]MCO7040714.1 DUF523 domain-containing protein [Staphylococcus lugdunensis]QEX29658.1 DUF523 domain-containing protein [Staphylococcus lugdunensis]